MNYIIYYGLGLGAVLITIVAQVFINITYSKYKKIPNMKKMCGLDTAREILDSNGLNDLYVVMTKGFLSDHYDPRRRVIRLSNEVYKQESIASVAIAAHECGHALQDKDNYLFLKIRAFLVPIVNVSSFLGYIAIMIGFVANLTNFIFAGIVLESIILLFQFITLPVEINASKRGLLELKKLNVLNAEEMSGAKMVLISAALTYVASLASTFLELFRLILIFTDNKD